MWEISNTSQAVSFLYSVILGLFFALLYDVFRSLRIVFSQTKLSVFLEDIIYFLFLSVTTFIFLLLRTNGEIRAYILVGIIFGFLLFIFTLSKYYLIILIFILKVFSNATKFILNKFYLLFSVIDAFFQKIFKNTLKYLKKCLKKVVNMLYTNSKSI